MPYTLPPALSSPSIDRLSSRESGIYGERSNQGERSSRTPRVQRSMAACPWRYTSSVLRAEQSPQQKKRWLSIWTVWWWVMYQESECLRKFGQE